MCFHMGASCSGGAVSCSSFLLGVSDIEVELKTSKQTKKYTQNCSEQ